MWSVCVSESNLAPDWALFTLPQTVRLVWMFESESLCLGCAEEDKGSCIMCLHTNYFFFRCKAFLFSHQSSLLHSVLLPDGFLYFLVSTLLSVMRISEPRTPPSFSTNAAVPVPSPFRRSKFLESALLRHPPGCVCVRDSGLCFGWCPPCSYGSGLSQQCSVWEKHVPCGRCCLWLTCRFLKCCLSIAIPPFFVFVFFVLFECDIITHCFSWNVQ